MRILTTGATGFLGRALVPGLRAAGHTVFDPVHSPFFNIGNQTQGASAVFGSLIPIEGAEKNVRLAIAHLAKDTRDEGNFQTNILGTALMVDSLPEGSRFIFASSIAAPASRDHYEAECLLGEQIVQARHDICAVVLRLANCYGAGKPNDRTVLNQIMRQAITGEPIHLYGAASGIRDYIYRDDVVSAFLAALDAPPGIYDVGTGIGTSLLEATEEVCRQTGHPRATTGELTYSHAPLADTRKWLPGWEPKVALKEGIALTLAAMRAEGQQVAA